MVGRAGAGGCTSGAGIVLDLELEAVARSTKASEGQPCPDERESTGRPATPWERPRRRRAYDRDRGRCLLSCARSGRGGRQASVRRRALRGREGGGERGRGRATARARESEVGTTGQRADSILDRTAWSTSYSKSDGEQSRRAAAESRPGPRARGGGRLVLHLAPAQPCCADLDNDPSSSRDRPGASLSRRSELWSPSSSSSPFTAPLASISSTRTRLAQGSARQLPGPSLTPLWPRQTDPRPTKRRLPLRPASTASSGSARPHRTRLAQHSTRRALLAPPPPCPPPRTSSAA